MIDRTLIVAEALSWIGTPYRERARVKGVGVDCAMILCEVYEASGLTGRVDPGHYNPQHALHSSRELYLEHLRSHTREIPESEVQPGDIVLYKAGRAFSHSAIVVAWPGEVIHATREAGVVLSHGTKEHWLQGRDKRFFTVESK